MAMVLITHDLGVVRDRTDSLVVMYGGRVMESAPTQELFTDTAHPYTHALRRSIPDMSMPRGTRLDPIPGSPPDLAIRPASCPFAPRCTNASDQCHGALPAIETLGEAGSRHSFACFNPQHGEF